MEKTIEHDAVEFGQHIRAGGWRLGLLVARNVEKGKRGGDRRANRDRDLDGKVTASEFARQAGTSADRVLRYLDAWERAAAAGVPGLVAAADLSPGDDLALDVETLPAWGDYYDASAAGGYNGGDDRQPTAAGVSKAVEKLDDAALAEVAEAVETQRVERKLYPDRPKPSHKKATQAAKKKDIERQREEPTAALVRLGTRIADWNVSTRALVAAYQDFRAIVSDEEILAAGRERLLTARGTADLALGEVIEGSFEEALGRLVEAERN